MVIAIDGPAGAGKSTVARAVAERLGFTYLDTGAMYRCVALAASERRRRRRGRRAIEIELGERVLLDGRDVTDAIRTPEVSEASSRVAADPAVRTALVRKQQAILATATGSPRAATSAPSSRPTPRSRSSSPPIPRSAPAAAPPSSAAGRGGAGRAARARRARRAAGHSPLKAANDAVPVDTTGLDLDEVVEQIVTLAVEAKEIEA